MPISLETDAFRHVRNGYRVEEAGKEPLDLPFAVPKFEYDDVVEVKGLEPSTYGMQSRRSSS
jgi:hypothetical protein